MGTTAKGEKGLLDFLLEAKNRDGDKVPVKVTEMLSTYDKASQEAARIKELLNSGALKDFSQLDPVDGLTILVLASIIDEETTKKAWALALKLQKEVTSKGGKKAAANNKAHQALKKIEEIDWPNYKNRHLIIQGKQGHIKAFVNLMEEKYTDIERRKSIEELVTRLKKEAQQSLPAE